MFSTEINMQDISNNKIVEERKVMKNNLNSSFVFSKAGILAGIVKISPKEEKNLSYSELPRTQEDEKKIEDLISTMGVHGKITLLLQHEKRLRKIGDELRYLHPFKFLGFIFSHRDSNSELDLKKHMAEIFDDYFKRTNFVKDYSQTMDVYVLKNKLNIYINDFANEINVPADKITPFIINKDWEGLLRFLINY